MKMRYLALVCLSLSFISVAACRELTSDDLDVVYLSECKFNLRRETPYNRCDKFAESIKLQLKDNGSKVDILVKVRKLLRERQSLTLAEFTNNCISLLGGKQPELTDAEVKIDDQAIEKKALEEQLIEAKEEIASLRHTLGAVVNKLNAWKAKFNRI